MQEKSQDIPEQFSNLEGMGTPVEVFQPKTSFLIQFILAGIFLVIGSGALLYGLSIAWNRWGRYYPPVILQAAAPWLIIFVISFGISLLFLWRMFNIRNKAVVIYTNGFAYSDRKGIQSWYWDQVSDVTANVVRHYASGIHTGTSYTYKLQNFDGKTIELNDSLKNVETLYSYIQNNTLQHRYKRLADAYNYGEIVAFGPVKIGKKLGIQIGKKNYPWEDIGEVAINKGILSIKKKDGRWFSKTTASTGEIPNLHVLLSIINQIVGLKAGK